MKNMITLFIVCYSTIMIGQKKEYVRVLEADSTWSKEIFPFPIHFAPEINFEGYEDAQFPIGWGKPESPEFWSYLFAWNINHSGKFSEQELETNLTYYFDGLMKVVNDDKELTVPPSTVLILKVDRITHGSDYLGKVRVYDAFRTKEMITLQLRVDVHPCENQDKSIVVFRFSPKGFDDDIWKLLQEVTLKPNSCEL